jgi:serine protease Do
VSSPPVVPPWACADGLCRVRILRARKWPAGFLALAASLLVGGVSPPARGQFPIRQIPRLQSPAPPPAASLPANALPQQLAAAQPAQTPHPAVARIVVPENGAVSYGSGTLVDVRGAFGLVVTNWHVVRDAAGQVSVEFPGGFKSPAQVVKTDKDWDLAALSIYRPPVSPIAVTAIPPQLGEWLTIAGYGSGDYRSASGALANYVSPSPDLPQEMLDVARVEARQGDSGGPIFNQRGELCGVLFGAGHGYTNGSYGGRVLKFLASVVPDGNPGGDLASPPLDSLAANTSPAFNSSSPQATALHQPQPPAASGWALRDVAPSPEKDDSLTPIQPPVDPPLLAPPPAGELTERYGHSPTLSGLTPPEPRVAVAPAAADAPADAPALIHSALPPRIAVPPTAAGVDLNQAPPTALAAAIWKQVGGKTALDQGKTILAVVGVLSLLVLGWRMSSQREVEHED